MTTPQLKSQMARLLTATAILAAAGANAYELSLGTNMPPVNFHGFLSQGFLYSTDYDYLGGDTTDGSFQFTEMGLNASMNPFPKTRIAVQGFAFDVGDIGNLEPFLDYGSIEYTFNNYIGIRAGRVRRPGGIYNNIQDLDLARTAVLLPQGVYDARWRDFSASIDGAVLAGSVPLKQAGSFSYEAFVGIPNISEEGGVAHRIVDEGGYTLSTMNLQFEQPLFVGSQFWWNTPLDGLRAGVFVGKMFGWNIDAQVPNFRGTGLEYRSENPGDVVFQQYSLEYLWKNWTFQGEYYTYEHTYDKTSGLYSGSTLVMPIAPYSGGSVVSSWYLGTAYRFNDWLQVGTYYTEYDLEVTPANPNVKTFQNDLALSFRFDPTPWWILKVEGHCIRGTALLQDSARNPIADQNNDPWFMLALKTTFSF